jgi:HEPN domain-containing protein
MRRSPEEEGRRWLEQAAEDLASAELLSREGRHYLACFVAQQVAEKAFKALLYAEGEALVLGHSVEQLGRRAAGRRPELAEVARRTAALDAHYIPTRYPNGLPDSIPARVFGPEASEQAVELARAALEAVRKAWPASPG